jgi:hypothetical protein
LTRIPMEHLEHTNIKTSDHGINPILSPKRLL